MDTRFDKSGHPMFTPQWLEWVCHRLLHRYHVAVSPYVVIGVRDAVFQGSLNRDLASMSNEIIERIVQDRVYWKDMYDQGATWSIWNAHHLGDDDVNVLGARTNTVPIRKRKPLRVTTWRED